MKKMMLTLCTVLFVSGCGYISGIEKRSDSVYIHIKNRTDVDFYGFELNMPNHSHTVVYADGSEVEKGESMIMELLKEDMNIAGQESFELFVLTDQQGEKLLPVEHFYTLDYSPGKNWYFELENGEGKGLALYKER